MNSKNFYKTCIIVLISLIVGFSQVKTIYGQVSSTNINPQDVQKDIINKVNLELNKDPSSQSVQSTSSVTTTEKKESFTGSIANPPKANAQVADGALSGIQSIYQLLRSEADFASGRLDVEQWFKDIIGTAIPNMALLLIGGAQCDNSTVWGGNRSCEWALPTDAFLTLDQDSLKSSGVAGLVATTADSVISNPDLPGSMALFINNTVSTSIFGKSALAQDINVTRADAFFSNVIFSIWTVTRNIAMTLIAVVFSLGAIGVMFRHRISSQAVITIYSLLPYVPIVILLIIFSYPIMIIAMNGALILWNAIGGAALSVAAEFGGDGFGDADVNRPAIAFLSGVINGNFNALIEILPASLSSVYILLFVMFMIIALGIVFIYQFAKIYLKFATYTIFMPLIMLTALVPGRQWVILHLFKKVMVEIILAPYIITAFFIALGLISTVSDTEARVAEGFSYLSQTVGVMVVYVLAWGLVWGISGVRRNIEYFMGTSGSVFGFQDLKK